MTTGPEGGILPPSREEAFRLDGRTPSQGGACAVGRSLIPFSILDVLSEKIVHNPGGIDSSPLPPAPSPKRRGGWGEGCGNRLLAGLALQVLAKQHELGPAQCFGSIGVETDGALQNLLNDL